MEKLARAKGPRVVQVMAGLASEYDVVMVARADGTLAADVRPLVRLSVTVIAEQKGRREVGSSGGGGRFGLAYFSDEQITQYVDEAVHSALVNLESRPAPAGVMTVVLARAGPGVLFHEAVGHGLEGDFNRKGSSAFSGRIGQRVAAKGVTVLDDGTIPDRRGSLNVDDEGHVSQRNVLIEDGILKGYIQDSMNARLMGVKPTGNGRRESYAHIPMPRMTNTYMLGGDKDAKSSAPSKRACTPATSPVGRWTLPAASLCSRPAKPIGGKRQDPVPRQGCDHHRKRPRVAQAHQRDRQRYAPGLRCGGTCGKRSERAPHGCGPTCTAYRWPDGRRNGLIRHFSAACPLKCSTPLCMAGRGFVISGS